MKFAEVKERPSRPASPRRGLYHEASGAGARHLRNETTTRRSDIPTKRLGLAARRVKRWRGR